MTTMLPPANCLIRPCSRPAAPKLGGPVLTWALSLPLWELYLSLSRRRGNAHSSPHFDPKAQTQAPRHHQHHMSWRQQTLARSTCSCMIPLVYHDGPLFARSLSRKYAGRPPAGVWCPADSTTPVQTKARPFATREWIGEESMSDPSLGPSRLCLVRRRYHINPSFVSTFINSSPSLLFPSAVVLS